MTYNVFGGTLNPTLLHTVIISLVVQHLISDSLVFLKMQLTLFSPRQCLLFNLNVISLLTTFTLKLRK